MVNSAMLLGLLRVHRGQDPLIRNAVLSNSDGIGSYDVTHSWETSTLEGALQSLPESKELPHEGKEMRAPGWQFWT